MVDDLPKGAASLSARQYWCFISYRHDDNRQDGRRWASWLHRAIENYAVPPDLVGRKNLRGQIIPARIFPVFRDEEELPVDADLATPIARALEASETLLAICSPRAVGSLYVGREIAYYKQIGRSDRVLAAIIDGEPNASWDEVRLRAGVAPERECFPAALRHRVDAAGTLLDERAEPIAADFRFEDGTEAYTDDAAILAALRRSGLSASEARLKLAAYDDRRKLMLLKIFAGVLGVELGELTRRDAAYQLAQARRRAVVLRRWLSAVAVLSLAALAGGAVALHQKTEADRRRDQAEAERSQILADKARQAAKRSDFGLARALALEALPRDDRASAPSQGVAPDAAATLSDIVNADRLLAAFSGGGRVVDHAVFSPDGKYLAVADDAQPRIYELATARLMLRLRGHAFPVAAMAYDPSGERLATASSDSTVKIWEARTGRLLSTLEGHQGGATEVAFSGNGDRLLTAAGDGAAWIWDARSGAKLVALRGHADQIRHAEFSADGALALTVSNDGSARVWDARSGATLSLMRDDSFKVMSAAFSPSGERVAIVGTNRAAAIFDARSGALRARLEGHGDHVLSVAFSPDGARVVTTGKDGAARIFDAESGRLIRRIDGEGGGLNSAVFSPDGELVLTGADDGAARLYLARRDGAALAVLRDGRGGFARALFSPDGASALTLSHDSLARLWDARPMRADLTLAPDGDHLTHLAFSPDGARLAAGAASGFAWLWDARTATMIAKMDSRTTAVAQGKDQRASVSALAFSPDGAKLALGAESGALRLFDGASGAPAPISPPGHETVVTTLAFSPDGKRLASGSFDQSAAVWDLATGALQGRFRSDDQQRAQYVMSVGFDRSGDRLLAGFDDDKARVWSLPSGKLLRDLAHDAVHTPDMAFSPSGEQAIGAGDDVQAVVWDVASGEIALTLRGHDDTVVRARYRPDGARIVTASRDKTARVWDARSGAPLLVLGGHAQPLADASFSADGARIMTSSSDGSAQLFDAASGARLAAFVDPFGPLSDAALAPDGGGVATLGANGAAHLWRLAPAGAARAHVVDMSWLTRAERRDNGLPSGETAAEATADACDILAGSPYDPLRRAPGVPFLAVEGQSAEAACRAALTRAPLSARLHFQLARALDRLGQTEEGRLENNLAAEAGYAVALHNRAQKTPDRAAARADLRRAFDGGAAVSAGPLGDFYWSGELEAADRDQALAIWRAGADRGDPASQALLARLYEQGEGVPVDLAEAAFRHGLAAELYGALGDDQNAAIEAARRGALARALPPEQAAALWLRLLDWRPAAPSWSESLSASSFSALWASLDPRRAAEPQTARASLSPAEMTMALAQIGAKNLAEGHEAAAWGAYEQSLRAARRQAARAPDDLAAQRQLIDVLRAHANVDKRADHWFSARDLLRETLAPMTRFSAADPQNIALRDELATLLDDFADLSLLCEASQQNKNVDLDPFLSRLAGERSQSADQTPEARAKALLARSDAMSRVMAENTAAALLKQPAAKTPEAHLAVAAWRESAKLRREILAQAPDDHAQKLRLGVTLDKLAAVELMLDDKAHAAEDAREAWTLARALLASDPASEPVRRLELLTLAAAAGEAQRASNPAQAVMLLKQAQDRAAALSRASTPSPELLRDVALAGARIAAVRRDLGLDPDTRRGK